MQPRTMQRGGRARGIHEEQLLRCGVPPPPPFFLIVRKLFRPRPLVGVAGFRLGNGTTFLILMDKRVRHLKQTTLERLQNPTQDGLYSGVPMGRKSRKSKSNYSVPINV